MMRQPWKYAAEKCSQFRWTITEAAGAVLLLIGLYCVWYPLPLLVGGAGLLGFGTLMDFCDRNDKERQPPK